VVKNEVSCDKCRAVIVTDRTKLVIETGPLRKILITDSGESVVDLCPRCAEAWLAWLRTSGRGD
jgi:hypothetical protein